MDSGLDPQRLMAIGLDPQMLKDLDLDPKKTMDFAIFGFVCCDFLFPSGTHESMARFVGHMIDEDVKRIPPLKVVLYEDLLEAVWGWDRLLPWLTGYILFEDYFRYLEQYYLRNIHPVYGLHAAAAECVEAEDALSSIVAGHGVNSAGHHELGEQIKERALRLLVACPDPSTTVPAACLMCIAEEARLLSELFRILIANADDESYAELLRNRIKFGNEVRKVVLDILTTYRGPYSKQISAPMLGMKTEAIVAYELLHRYDADYEERFEICEEVRDFTLELLKIIRDRFPRESAIDYRPIDHARAIMTRKRAEHTPV